MEKQCLGYNCWAAVSPEEQEVVLQNQRLQRGAAPAPQKQPFPPKVSGKLKNLCNTAFQCPSGEQFRVETAPYAHCAIF